MECFKQKFDFKNMNILIHWCPGKILFRPYGTLELFLTCLLLPPCGIPTGRSRQGSNIGRKIKQPPIVQSPVGTIYNQDLQNNLEYLTGHLNIKTLKISNTVIFIILTDFLKFSNHQIFKSSNFQIDFSGRIKHF